MGYTKREHECSNCGTREIIKRQGEDMKEEGREERNEGEEERRMEKREKRIVTDADEKDRANEKLEQRLLRK